MATARNVLQTICWMERCTGFRDNFIEDFTKIFEEMDYEDKDVMPPSRCARLLWHSYEQNKHLAGVYQEFMGDNGENYMQRAMEIYFDKFWQKKIE